MKRFSKALIAGMVCLSAVALVLLALATWIISAPDVPYYPNGNTAFILKLSAPLEEYGENYNSEAPVDYGTLLSNVNADTAEQFETKAITVTDQTGREYAVTLNEADGLSNGSNANLGNSGTSGQRAVGNTYQVTYNISLGDLADPADPTKKLSEDPNCASLYQWDPELSPRDGVITLTRLVKYKTVQIVKRNPNDNNNWDGSSDWDTWYTIEEALKAASASSGNLETTVRIAGKAVVDGSTITDSTIETSFTKLPDGDTGYSVDHRTIKNGVTLLLPVADRDNTINGKTYALTSGTIESYSGGLQLSGLGNLAVLLGIRDVDPVGDLTPIPHNYNLPTPLYSRLTVPNNITIVNNGTLTVGGISGAGEGGTTPKGHLNRITGNYSELLLDGNGKLVSHGTLNAYGNIVGSGSIDAQEGLVRERFETLGWPNGQAFLARYIGKKNLQAQDILSGGRVTIDDPNEFPVEDYQLVAIETTMTVSSHTKYVANFRLFIGSQSKLNDMVTTGEQFAIADFAICDRYQDTDNAEGIFLLREGATLTKTVTAKKANQGQRMNFTINGGAVGGYAELDMNVMVATFTADTKQVKFPVSSNLDLVLRNGEYDFNQGYEFMGPTSLDYNSDDNNNDGDSTDNAFTYKTTGATLTLENRATLNLENSLYGGNDKEDGIIFYAGTTVLVCSGCTLKIGGQLGGTISGEGGATLTVKDNLSQGEGYIGGSGSIDITMSGLSIAAAVEFAGTLTTLPAQGDLYQTSTQHATDSFVAGVTYHHNGTCWVCETNQVNVTYNANGGTFGGGSETQTQTVGATSGLQGTERWFTPDGAPQPTRPYYRFLGWATNQDATEAIAGVSFKLGDPITLYAVWQPIEYKIEFIYTDENGTQQPHSQPWYFNDEATWTLWSPSLPSDDYTFSGWQKEEGGTETPYTRIEPGMGFFDPDETHTQRTLQLFGKIEQSFDAVIRYTLGNVDETDYAAAKSALEAAEKRSVHSGERASGLDLLWMAGEGPDTDKDILLSKYFTGWMISANGGQVGLDEPVSSNLCTEEGETRILTLVAQWADKTTVTFTDTVVGFTSRTYYYKPGQSVAVTNDNELVISAPNNEEIPIADNSGNAITREKLCEKNEIRSVSTYYNNGGWDHLGKVDEGVKQITLPAKRLNKVIVKYVDTDIVAGDLLTGTPTNYYKPDQTASLKDAKDGYDLAAKDYDVTVSTYFAGTWTMSGGNGSFWSDSGDYTVAEGDSGTVTIKTNRANKFTLEIETIDATIKITAKDHDNIQSAYGGNGNSSSTLYFMENTVITVEVTQYRYTGRNDSRSFTIDTESATGSQQVTMDREHKIYAESQYGGCLVEGTLITLADGTQKKVEDLLPTDEVLIYNHFTGKYEAGTILFDTHANRPADDYIVTNLKFANGTTLRIVESHGLFDLDLNRYVYLNHNNAKDFIGHRFATAENVNGEFVAGETVLTDVVLTNEHLKIYSPMTVIHFNIVAENMLTITSFMVDGSEYGVQGFVNIFEYEEGSMKYDEEKMQADIEKYGLFTYEDFEDLIPEELFEASVWRYFKVAIGKGNLTWQQVLDAIDYILHSGEV